MTIDGCHISDYLATWQQQSRARDRGRGHRAPKHQKEGPFRCLTVTVRERARPPVTPTRSIRPGHQLGLSPKRPGGSASAGPGTFCCWCYQEYGELAFSHWTNDCYGLNARFEHEDCARNRLYHRTGFERLEELTERLRAENAMLEAKLRGGPLLQLVPAGS